MRLIGKRGEANLFFLPAVLKSAIFPNQLSNLRFYVDTGASLTAISDTDAITNRIPYERLQIDPIELHGINQSVRTRQLPNSEILFLTDQNTKYTIKCPLLRIMDRGNSFDASFNRKISLLGIDVLQNFRISFQGDRVILEKDIVPPPIPKIPSLPKVKPFKPNLPI